MVDTRVIQRSCTLCGAAPNDGFEDGVCSDCIQVLGSVVIVPAPTRVSAPAASSARSGIFGDYEIISELAHGGMGIVYVARQISLNRRVALKTILTPFARPEQIRRFQAEAEHAATLEHPNIVPVYDSGSIDGVPYFSMKLIQGRSLNASLRRLILEPRKGVAIMATVARAVHFAHQRGILHRDLKPANILIDEQGVPYVGDFGIAKRLGTDNGMTREGAIIGTPYYMPPEQAGGASAALTTAADVYGLGAILYEVLTLRAPFQGSERDDILLKVKTEDPIAPRKLRPSVDRDLETICLKCLEKSPARRYESAEALACDLERWMQGEPIAARPHSMFERAAKWARRHLAIVAAAALVVLCAFAVGGFYGHSAELVRRAEQAKIEERRRASFEDVDAGMRALQSAQAALAANRGRESEDALIEAEDRFRTALVNLPDNVAAQSGLRETALLNFDASLRGKNYRQAREKLLLAHSAKLDDADFQSKQAQLATQESERGGMIRARVKALMDDAASLARSVTHEDAVYELIALKDPLTVEQLAAYIGHERPECRRLAFAALAWMGDASVAAAIRPYIETKLPNQDIDNPPNVQEAAINAVCKLAADDDAASYAAVQARLNREPGEQSSLLFNRVKLSYGEFARRQARAGTGGAVETNNQLFDRAQKLSAAQSYRECLALYDRLVAADPANTDYLNARGLARLNVKDAAGALADFNDVVAHMPNRKEGYVNRASARLSLHDAAGALSDLKHALLFAPNDATLWSTRGLAYMDLGDVKKALADYDHALQLNPDELFALTNRGHAHAALKDFQSALADFDRAVALSPQFKQALTGRACTRMELHDSEGAIADFDRTLALDPTQSNCFYNRAVLKMNRSDWKDAIRDFDHHIALEPLHAAAWYNRGICESRCGMIEGAARDYAMAIELDPRRATAMVNLGLIREEAGDNEAAMRLFGQAIEVNPKLREAWSARAALNFKLKHAHEAVGDIKAAQALLPPSASREMNDEYVRRVAEYEAADRGE